MLGSLVLLSSLLSCHALTTSYALPNLPSPSLRNSRRLRMSMLDGNDPWAMWAAAATSAMAGLAAEKTPVGRSLSGPVCAMLFSAVATNLSLLPAAGSPHIAALQTFAVKAALPLLLFGADLNKIRRETGYSQYSCLPLKSSHICRALLRAFLLGSLATLFSSLLGFSLLLPQFRSEAAAEGWKVVSALTAKNIGGGINFVAVADALSISPATVSLALTVDNLYGLLYFPLVSSLCSPSQQSNTTTPTISLADDKKISSEAVTSESLLSSISLALAVTAVAEAMGKWCGVSSQVSVTLLTVAMATVLPTPLYPLLGTSELLGKTLLMLFFGSIGNSAGTLASLVGNRDILLILKFGAILYAGHLAFILTIGRLLRLPLPDLLLASNANIGNGATASALAASKGWTDKVKPALLVGTLGNIIGTIVGLWLGVRVLRPFST